MPRLAEGSGQHVDGSTNAADAFQTCCHIHRVPACTTFIRLKAHKQSADVCAQPTDNCFLAGNYFLATEDLMLQLVMMTKYTGHVSTATAAYVYITPTATWYSAAAT
jgi:hypothetical protein